MKSDRESDVASRESEIRDCCARDIDILFKKDAETDVENCVNQTLVSINQLQSVVRYNHHGQHCTDTVTTLMYRAKRKSGLFQILAKDVSILTSSPNHSPSPGCRMFPLIDMVPRLDRSNEDGIGNSNGPDSRRC